MAINFKNIVPRLKDPNQRKGAIFDAVTLFMLVCVLAILVYSTIFDTNKGPSIVLSTTDISQEVNTEDILVTQLANVFAPGQKIRVTAIYDGGVKKIAYAFDSEEITYTEKAEFVVAVPAEYADGKKHKLRIRAEGNDGKVCKVTTLKFTVE